MKKSILLSGLVFIALSSAAQTADTAKPIKNWTKGGVAGLNIGQSSFTNWAAGGENSISIGAMLSVYAKYNKGKAAWENTLDLAYGMIQSGLTPLRKNDDKIDFASKYGYKAINQWYYTAFVGFKSQFADGYNYPNDSVIVSHFMAPGHLLGSLGMDYKSKDNTLSFFISPVTSKITFVNDQKLADAGAYGVRAAKYDTVGGVYKMVSHGDMLLDQFGAYIKFTYKKDIFKNVNFATKLELFSNYLENPQNIVVNWENILAMKVNKYITTTISTVMIYDHNVPVPVKRIEHGVEVLGTGPRLQFKEVLVAGVFFKF